MVRSIMGNPDFGWLTSCMGGSLSKGIDLMSAIISAKTDADLLAAVTSAACQSGFERVLIGTQWVDTRGQRRFQVLSGYPDAWQTEYALRGYMAIDPTVSHCQLQTSSLIWSQRHFIEAGAMNLFEEARSFGLGYGVSIPVHELTGVKTMVSLVRDKPLDTSPLEARELVKAGEVIGNIAHFAFRRLITPQITGASPKKLTPSELTAIRWVANGKTSAEIGQILGVSDATVVFHLRNAMEKLGVVNRPQAIAAAFRLGLLD